MMRTALLSLAPLITTAAASPFIQGQGKDVSAVFNHQALHVRDLPMSASFYEKVLGLQRIADPFKDDLHVWFDIGSGMELHVIGGATAVGPQNMDVHMAFSVVSVDAFVRHLDSLKIRYVNSKSVERQVTTRPDGVKQVYFQDPDGYWIEVNDAGRSR